MLATPNSSDSFRTLKCFSCINFSKGDINIQDFYLYIMVDFFLSQRPYKIMFYIAAFLTLIANAQS